MMHVAMCFYFGSEQTAAVQLLVVVEGPLGPLDTVPGLPSRPFNKDLHNPTLYFGDVQLPARSCLVDGCLHSFTSFGSSCCIVQEAVCTLFDPGLGSRDIVQYFGAAPGDV